MATSKTSPKKTSKKKMAKRPQTKQSKGKTPKKTPPIDSFSAAVNYLFEQTDFERMRVVQYDEDTFKLDRMRTILKAIGNPQEKVAMIHVAGTVGKGSTVAMISSVLKG
ncbi:hypothetical protein H8D99_00765, partial [bacterium]|nr:hypothetical protein [bacterium]